MTGNDWLSEAIRPVPRLAVDPSVPNVARVWNYLSGGRDNFDADRRAARLLIKGSPAMEYAAPAAREFIGRATRYLAGEGGIRQFLDIGTGIPVPGSVHDVAQSLARDSRVVCVDNDPVVASHARALLRPAPEGATGYVDADVRQTGKIITEAGATLDFGQPVAIVMNHLLNYVERDAEVRHILATLLDAAAPGSYLVVTHPASDVDQTLVEAARRWNRTSTVPVVLRSRAQVTAWFEGLDIVEPGVVTVPEWRPDSPADNYGESLPLYGAVGRKPDG